MPDPNRVDAVWRSFELDPAAPRVAAPAPYAERLARHYGASRADAGLEAADVRAVLAGDLHADAVRADDDEAHALGIRGVPFFVAAGWYGVSGAQPADVLHRVLTKAWDELPPDAVAEGAVCGPDGCG